MFNPKQLIQWIACVGLALVFWALASKILNSETVSLSVSPIDGIHVTAEGSRPSLAQQQAGR